MAIKLEVFGVKIVINLPFFLYCQILRTVRPREGTVAFVPALLALQVLLLLTEDNDGDQRQSFQDSARQNNSQHWHSLRTKESK